MKSYSIRNIKSFKEETKIEIKPITIFVGKNSCGKSSLIRFPVVLSQSFLSDADTPILLFGNNIDYGNFEDVVFDHEKRGKIGFSVSYDVMIGNIFEIPNDYKKLIDLSKEKTICIDVTLIKYSKRMMVDECNIFIDGVRSIGISRVQSVKYNVELIDTVEHGSPISFETDSVVFSKFVPYFSSDMFFDKIVESVVFDNSLSKSDEIRLMRLKNINMNRSLQNESSDLTELDKYDLEVLRLCKLTDYYRSVLFSARIQAREEAEETYYIGPFRENPSRVYRDGEHSVDSVGVHGENMSAVLMDDYRHGKRILKSVSEWISKSMNYGLSLKDMGSGLYNIVIKKDDGNADNIIDVGYGISQVLPIVTQLVKMRTNSSRRRYSLQMMDKTKSMLVIEQPELHLHPNAQAELANLFVDAVTEDSKNGSINVLIETHSEHLIRRLQALIADKSVNISNDQVAIYYVDKNEKNEGYITEMKILENGQFEKEWPSGFFDKAFELAMELMRNNA